MEMRGTLETRVVLQPAMLLFIGVTLQTGFSAAHAAFLAWIQYRGWAVRTISAGAEPRLGKRRERSLGIRP